MPETKILYADGTYKEIKDVKVGDQVMSYNTASNQFTKERVEKLIIHPEVMGTYLTINGTLKVTSNHPMWINQKWQDAGMAKIGDRLMTSSGKEIIISSIVTSQPGVNNLYNLHLDGSDHDYFAEDILVHNK